MKRILALGGTVAASAVIALAVPSLASASVAGHHHGHRPPSAAALTLFRNTPDSGYNGDWATDAYADYGTVTNVPSENSLCAAGSYFYAATDHDNGVSRTIVGDNSPGETSVVIARSVDASMEGGFTGITFCADSLRPSGWRVAPRVNGATTEGAALAGEIGTAAWYAQYFPAGTTLTSFTDPGWSWTYRLFQSPDGGRGYQQWIDGSTVPQASSGNIVVLPRKHHHHI